MCMQNTNRLCNAPQPVNALSLHATRTPAEVMGTLAHFGLSLSAQETTNMITSLTIAHKKELRAWASDHLVAFQHDNVHMLSRW